MLVVLLISILLILWVVYKRVARPSNFPPGPMNLPLIGYVPFTKFPYLKWMQLSQTYGDVFSIQMGSYWAIILSSLESIKTAFKDEAILGRPPIPLYVAWAEGLGMAFSNGRVWIESRRFIMKHLKDLGFGKSSLESTIKDEIAQFLDGIRSHEGEPVNLANKINLAVVNALWTIVAGKRFSGHDDPLGAQAVQSIVTFVKEASVSNPLEFFPWITKLGLFKEQITSDLQSVERIKHLMKDIINQQTKNADADSENLDFIHVYLEKMKEVRDPSSVLYGETGLRNLTVLLMDTFAGGSDTTATALLWFVLYMGTQPEVQRKAQAEIDAVVPSDRLPSLEDRPLLPYTEAALLETIRFSGFGPTGLIHTCTKDIEFMGFSIPKGTFFIANIYQVLHDPKHWEKPSEFYPEHFLHSDGTLKIPEAFIPFSVGKRNCPGETLARMELFLFGAALLQQFDFTFPHGERPSFEPVPGIVNSPQPFNIVARSRKTYSQ